VQLVKVATAKLMDEVSDHKLIKLVVGAEVRHKKDQHQWLPYDQAINQIPITKFPQSNIKKMMGDQSVQDHLVDNQISII
jgi:hypothetical protein